MIEVNYYKKRSRVEYLYRSEYTFEDFLALETLSFTQPLDRLRIFENTDDEKFIKIQKKLISLGKDPIGIMFPCSVKNIRIPGKIFMTNVYRRNSVDLTVHVPIDKMVILAYGVFAKTVDIDFSIVGEGKINNVTLDKTIPKDICSFVKLLRSYNINEFSYYQKFGRVQHFKMSDTTDDKIIEALLHLKFVNLTDGY
jgi:hypothetical protein